MCRVKEKINKGARSQFNATWIKEKSSLIGPTNIYAIVIVREWTLSMKVAFPCAKAIVCCCYRNGKYKLKHFVWRSLFALAESVNRNYTVRLRDSVALSYNVNSLHYTLNHISLIKISQPLPFSCRRSPYKHINFIYTKYNNIILRISTRKNSKSHAYRAVRMKVDVMEIYSEYSGSR